MCIKEEIDLVSSGAFQAACETDQAESQENKGKEAPETLTVV